MVFGIIILLAVVVIIWCLNCLSEQLSALYKKLNEIYDNLPNVLDRKAKEIKAKKEEKEYDAMLEKDYLEEFLEKLDYHDHVYMEGDFVGVTFSKGNMPSYKDNGGKLDMFSEKIVMSFNGKVKEQGGYGIDHIITSASCWVIFKKKTEEESLCFDNLDEIPRYDPEKSSGRVVSKLGAFEIYEDISEYEKYRDLVASGKKLSIYVSADIFKEKEWKKEYGWVTFYSIHVRD